MRETNTHVYFWGSYLSNFYWAPFELEIASAVHTFTTSEQCFMAFKAQHFKDEMSFKSILEAPDGKSAKAIGRKVRDFDPAVWDVVCYDYMHAAVFAKFMPEPKISMLPSSNILDQLLATGNRTLVEASPLDAIWGVGLHWNDDAILDEGNWKGKNLLGKVLMEVRSELTSINKE